MVDVEERARTRGFLVLGLICLSTAIVASCFLLAALQAAYSPFAMQLPAGPFEQLETEAFRLAFASFLLVLLWPRIAGKTPTTGPTRVFGAGAVTKLGVLGFAASQGMSAIQIADPRTLSPKLFAVRTAANVLLMASLLWTCALAYRHSKASRE